MQMDGEYLLPAPQDRVWQSLLDYDSLAACLPGGQDLRLIAPDEYEATVKIGVGAIRGVYSGKVRIADKNPPSSFRMEVEGTGKLGSIRATGHLELAPAENTTLVRYTGDYQVSGPIAAIGQRLFEPVAQMLMSQFFDCIESRLS